MPNYKCNYCTKKIINAKGLREHCLRSHNVKIFICTLCGDYFESKNLRDIHHVKRHTNGGTPCHRRCRVCGTHFKKTKIKAQKSIKRGMNKSLKAKSEHHKIQQSSSIRCKSTQPTTVQNRKAFFGPCPRGPRKYPTLTAIGGNTSND